MNNFPIPVATYRIQLNKDFTFKHASDQISYLKKLGISHVYTSPLLKTRKQSTHGYDVTDHSLFNPEIGTTEDFLNLSDKLSANNLSLIVDIVPNHIFIGDLANSWWLDVLKNGPKSIYAEYFDIDWHPGKATFDNKVYLPILSQRFGLELENQMFEVIYQDGQFFVQYRQKTLPTNPESWICILMSLLKEVQKIYNEKNPSRIELESIITSTIDSNRLNKLFKSNPTMLELLNKQLLTLKGIKGYDASFDELEKFLNIQHYRLCFWKVANDEINYRRFFDIFEYASIRMEKKEVFDAVHQLIFDYVQQGRIQGLRIDHIDGLWDPSTYLKNLFEKTNTFIIVEKILTGNENLPNTWSVQGTVGYDFLNLVNSLYIFVSHKSQFIEIYRNYTETRENLSKIIYESKNIILDFSLASELNLLTRRLSRIAEKHRISQDFTIESLKSALTNILIYFPVYRSYIHAPKNEIHEEDRKYINAAVSRAKKRTLNIEESVYDFIKSLLLLESPWNSGSLKAESADFVMHFQQITGPVMAKGMEDTAFYRYYPLCSLNEVGGDIGSFGISIKNFHSKNLERYEFWPNSLNSSSTHDTKRSEDMRARLNVLSEIPQSWDQLIHQWNEENQSLKEIVDDEMIPDKNEEYLIYQTLLGAWPLDEMDDDNFCKFKIRIYSYIEKAVKEAKINQSWLNPNEKYIEGLTKFIDKVLNNTNFLKTFIPFTTKLQNFGMLNSLSQLLIKLTSPGIPDIYQGNEIWDFSLTDPDNRHPIDFQVREKFINELSHSKNFLKEYLERPRDGKIKLFMTQQTLMFRNREMNLFSKGVYMPLNILGPSEEYCIAFARIYENKFAIILASRFFTFFMNGFNQYKNIDHWKETFLGIPLEFVKLNFKDIYTQKLFHFESQKIPLEDLFSTMPFVLLESIEPEPPSWD